MYVPTGFVMSDVIGTRSVQMTDLVCELGKNAVTAWHVIAASTDMCNIRSPVNSYKAARSSTGPGRRYQ